jgi:hypothetical protein
MMDLLMVAALVGGLGLCWLLVDFCGWTAKH